MADEFDEKAAELLPCSDKTIPRKAGDLYCVGDDHDAYECPAFHRQQVATRLRIEHSEAKAQGFAEAREAAAKIAERRWHTSGTDCTDYENCGIVKHNRYQPDSAARLIRLIPTPAEKEP
jgi:hypothetical protein